MPEQTREKLLEVKDLHVVFGKGKRAFEAIKGVSFDIYKGENLALWGNPDRAKPRLAGR